MIRVMSIDTLLRHNVFRLILAGSKDDWIKSAEICNGHLNRGADEAIVYGEFISLLDEVVNCDNDVRP